MKNFYNRDFLLFTPGPLTTSLSVKLAGGLNAGCWTVGVVFSSNEVGMSEEEFLSLPTSEKENIFLKISATFRIALCNNSDQLSNKSQCKTINIKGGRKDGQR